MVQALLKNYRQSPRKVRMVVDAIRGKNVNDALNVLTFTVKRSSDPVKKLLDSAIANAKHNHGIDSANLFIKEITVNEGATFHRFMPRARGSAAPIRKRTSHVKIVLAEIDGGKTSPKTGGKTIVAETPKTTTKKTAKKPAVKKTAKTSKKTNLKSKK